METLSLTRKNEERLRVLERDIIRGIKEPKKMGENEFRRNCKIEDVLKEEDTVMMTNSQRIRYYGYFNG